MAAESNRPGRHKASRRNRLVAEILESRQLLAVITVNSTGDSEGADGGIVLSLRQAIEISDGTLAISALSSSQGGLVRGTLSTPNTIDFAIASGIAGPFVIEPSTALPAITKPVVIDGYSQAGAHPNTNGPGRAKNTVIQIELDGAKAPGANGLEIQAGDSTVEGLAIGGFATGAGILLETEAGDLIQGDFIGTDATGTTPLPNSTGVVDTQRYVVANGSFNLIPGSNTIGGTAAGAGNVLSGNSTSGLGLAGGGPGIAYVATVTDLVEGNFIGTDVTGSRALPNGGGGINDAGGGTSTIGGTTAGAGNVISGNTGTGLAMPGYFISGGFIGSPSFVSSSQDLVEGNLIGTDLTGSTAVPNTGDGLQAGGKGITIGGTTAGAGNVLSGNSGVGLAISDGPGGVVYGGASVLVEGNKIGTDFEGSGDLANGGDGINLANVNGGDTIGGTAAGASNVIGNNGGAGVAISTVPSDYRNLEPRARYSISANSIFGNGDLGINYVPAASTKFAVTPPTLGSVTASGTGSMITGTVAGYASSTYSIEFFANVIPDPSGAGQGQVYLGSTTVTTDAAGNGVFAFASPMPLLGRYVSATATLANTSDLFGELGINASTSEFAPNLFGYTASTTTTLVGPSQVALAGQPVSLTASVASTFGVPTGQVQFFQDGVALGSSTLNASGIATFVTDQLKPGSHVLTASYLGDLSHTPSPSGALAVTVLAPVTFTLLGPNRVATQGQPITLTVAVISPGFVPSGLVEFLEDGVGLGSAIVNASGIASLITDQLMPGPHVITAVYLGDSNHPAAFSNAIAVEVTNVTAFGGPAVTSDVLTGPRAITVTFNRGLLMGPAQDLANYTIMGPRRQVITILSAVYNPANASVTLTTVQTLDPKLTYVLTINGQKGERVVDVFGIALNGKAKGKPGHNYSGKVVVKKVPVVKVAHPSTTPKPKVLKSSAVPRAKH